MAKAITSERTSHKKTGFIWVLILLPEIMIPIFLKKKTIKKRTVATNKKLSLIANKKCPCKSSEKALWLPQAGQ
jgi:hypothetical protein